MLPKKYRLTTPEVEYVQKYGKSIRTAFFILRYHSSNSTAVNSAKKGIGIAVVVSKKVEKGSVGRHALKRNIFRALEHSGIDFSMGTTHIVVTLLKPHTDLVQNNVYQNIVERVREVTK